MLTRNSVRNVQTTKVHAVVSVGDGHVPSVANVHTKSHKSRPEVVLFRFIVDLLAVVDEIRPMIGCQHDELTVFARRTYGHHTSASVDHPILPFAENK